MGNCLDSEGEQEDRGVSQQAMMAVGQDNNTVNDATLDVALGSAA